MTIYMNLHELPADQHMFMLRLMSKKERAKYPLDDCGVEEVDIVAPRRSTKDQVIEAAKNAGDAGLAGYDMDDMEVIAVSDETDVYFLWVHEDFRHLVH